jgi:predicted nucleic acid-binding protein
MADSARWFIETWAWLVLANEFVGARRFCEAIFVSSRLGLVDIEHVTPERFQFAWRMRAKYRDKTEISFTDLTSFVVMRELGLSQVITGDAHFEHVGLGFRKLP